MDRLEKTRSRWRVGTAGWSIPATFRARFDDGPSGLARYATRFNAVEINSSFYRSHKPDTYARWRDSVPEAFRFSVKLPRSITHDARLLKTSKRLDAFVEEISALGEKLEVILVQLPPSLEFDARRVSAFLAAFRRRFDRRVALEARHAEWFEPRADALLKQHGIARVAADPALVPSAARPGGVDTWSYWRLHGSPRMYYSPYGEARVTEVAEAMAACSGDAWCIFDNTASGSATFDALALKQLLSPDG